MSVGNLYLNSQEIELLAELDPEGIVDPKKIINCEEAGYMLDDDVGLVLADTLEQILAIRKGER